MYKRQVVSNRYGGIGRERRRNYVFSMSLMLLSGVIFVTSPTLAGPQHARVRLCKWLSCVNDGQCAPHGGVAHRVLVRGPAYVVSHAQAGYWYTIKSWPSGQGWHTGLPGGLHANHHLLGCSPLSIFRTTDDSRDSDPAEGGDPPVPTIGEPGNAIFASLTSAPGMSPNIVDFTFDPGSFLQLDLSVPEFGDPPLTASWSVDIAGAISTVSLVATPVCAECRLAGGYTVTANVTGVFDGPTFAITPMGNQLHVFQFTSAVEWSEPGDDELEVSLEGASCIETCSPVDQVPTASQWGVIAMGGALMAAAAVGIRRRMARSAVAV